MLVLPAPINPTKIIGLVFIFLHFRENQA